MSIAFTLELPWIYLFDCFLKVLELLLEGVLASGITST